MFSSKQMARDARELESGGKQRTLNQERLETTSQQEDPRVLGVGGGHEEE